MPATPPAHRPVQPLDVVPLNLFQQLARQWDAAHPYNAAQAVRVARAAPGAVAAGDTWGAALAALGLGRAVHTPVGNYGFEVLNGQLRSYPVRVAPPGAAVDDVLSAMVNEPFADAGEPPFRAVVVPVMDGTHWLGVVYQHWAADSVSVRRLLGEWFVRLHDPAAAERTRRAARLARADYWRRYGPRSGGWGAGHVLTFARRYFRYRTVRKVDGTGLDDPRVRYARRDAADGTPARLRAYARGQGVKVHDVLQAALIEACAAHVPMQRRRPWRRDVAAGAILDLRPHRPAVTDAAFGALLGFGAVACRPDDVRDWPRLLRSVARQNAVHKRGGVPQASLAWLLAARAAARFVPPPRLAHFYRKELPLAGGLSNVDLSRSWAAAYAPAVVLDYARVSPTGPIAPVAVAATTFAGRLGLGITHRAATIDAGRADALLRTMLGRIELLVASR